MKRISKLQRQIIALLSEPNEYGNHLYSVLAMQSMTGASQPSISRSLKTMMDAGIIVRERRVIEYWAWEYAYQLKANSELEIKNMESKGWSIDTLRQHYRYMVEGGLEIDYETAGKK